MSVNHRIIFKHILCPIDLAAASDEALRYAIALAKAYGAELSVIHCADKHDVTSPNREQIESLLDTAVRKYLLHPPASGFSWHKLVVEGDPKTVISSEASERGIDLIIMRSRRRPYAAALIGSTAESVCRTAPCPVMITHSEEQNWVGATANEIDLRRVLVAYDFSGDSELALSYGLSLAQEYQSEIHLLHMLEAPQPRFVSPYIGFPRTLPSSAFDDSLNGLAVANRLKDAMPAEASLWCAVRHAVREGPPYREVLSYADEEQIDLICMGASGAGFGMRALFGSNADRVLRQAPCPVLIARPLKPAFSKQLQMKINERSLR